MSLQKTEGIILQRKSFRENDRIFLIYSKKEGKLELVAKGTRKAGSKLAGSLEPFCLAMVMYAKGRSFDQITSVEVIDNFKNINNDPFLLSWLSLLVEIIEIHVKPKYKENKIFELLEKLFKTLDKNKEKEDKNTLIILSAIYKILEVLGFKPELYNCLGCSKKIKPKGNFFSEKSGGIICSSCHKKDRGAKKVSDEAIKTLRLLFECDFSKIKKLKVKAAALKEVKEATFRYLPYIIEKELKVIDFIRKTT